MESSYRISNIYLHWQAQAKTYRHIVIILYKPYMNFTTPPQLAKQFNTSLKTVYNYVTKYPDKIRTKKEFWKTLVSLEDFEKAITRNYNTPLQQTESNKEQTMLWTAWSEIVHSPSMSTNVAQDYKNTSDEIEQGKQATILWNLELKLQTVQNEKEQTHKYNLVLQEQVSKYALLLQEEKSEKKERIQKHDSLHEKLQSEQQRFFKERMQSARTYYFVAGLCVCLGVALAYLLWYYQTH